MRAFIVKVVPRHGVTREILDGVVCNSLRGGQEQRLVCFRIRHRKTIQGPTESSGPSGVRAKSLMRMGKCPLSRGSHVRKREFGLPRPSAQSEALPVVTRIVMYGLKDRSVPTHIPLRRAKRMFSADLSPTVISRFVAGPPEQLKIHHRVNNGVVSVLGP